MYESSPCLECIIINYISVCAFKFPPKESGDIFIHMELSFGSVKSAFVIDKILWNSALTEIVSEGGIQCCAVPMVAKLRRQLAPIIDRSAPSARGCRVGVGGRRQRRQGADQSKGGHRPPTRGALQQGHATARAQRPDREGALAAPPVPRETSTHSVGGVIAWLIQPVIAKHWFLSRCEITEPYYGAKQCYRESVCPDATISPVTQSALL